MNNPAIRLGAALLLALSSWCLADEMLITTAPAKDSEPVAYVLNFRNMTPKYVLVLFPGGNGIVDPRMQDGKLVYGKRGNFLLRARKFLVDDDFVTVATNSTHDKERVLALINDLKSRFYGAKIYFVGTSRGTYDTMELAEYLADKVAGEIHTSSLSQIASFDARKYANRHLVVHHKEDNCRVTPFSAAEASHLKYGNDLIVMEGGISQGHPCEALAYHGYNGIEQQTAKAIKRWVTQPKIKSN